MARFLFSKLLVRPIYGWRVTIVARCYVTVVARCYVTLVARIMVGNLPLWLVLCLVSYHYGPFMVSK